MNIKTGWIIGIIIVILVLAGVWWLRTQSMSPMQGGSGSITTTDRPNDSVATVVAGLSGASQGAGILSSTGVAAGLTGKGPYTVFVSTNAGFALLPPGTIANMTAAQKKRFAQYSVISGRALSVNAVDSGTVRALSGDTLNFNVQDTGLAQVNSSFVLAQYKAKNGIVYVLNQPLVPPIKGSY